MKVCKPVLRNAPRPFLVGALMLLGGLSSPAPADAALTLKLRCPGAGGKTVVRTSEVRIFTRVSPYFREPDNPDYYGCIYRRKKAFRVSLIDSYGVVVEEDLIRLAGRYVALVQDIGSAGDCDTGDEVVVRDLATGRAVYLGPRGLNGDVRDMTVKPNGVTAFTYETFPGVGPLPPDEQARRLTQIRVASSKSDIVVDQGPDIDPTSLELSAESGSVTYLKAGERRSASLP